MPDQFIAPPEAPREPTEEEILRLMHASDRQIYNSPDVSTKQKDAIFDFHKSKWKAAHFPSEPSDAGLTAGAKSISPDLLRIDPRKIDAEYKSFPSFGQWSQCTVDTARWNAHIRDFTKWRDSSPELLHAAREIVTRAAAIDTGALEHLYEVDRGFTFTIATQAAAWEATLNAKGPEVRALIESQMEAYEMVLDFATQKQPIAEVWIRELHSEICKSQSTYKALTEIGWQELALPKGQYKVSPNHVQGRDGKVHAYAPVDQVPSEMQKLVQELRSESFTEAHAVLQASYAHYAFVLIHPFADGNGRAARALASVYTYRAQSIPVLILSENRNSYINALMAADEGDFQPFVNFIFERVLDAIRLTSISLSAASAPTLNNALEEYDRLYITKGGYAHEEVDRAGYSLMNLVESELRKQSESINPNKIIVEVSVEHRSDYKLKKSSTRHPILESGRILKLKLTGNEPRQPNFGMHLNLEVPKDCDLEDELLLSSEQIDLSFPARITELSPAASAALHLRISIFVQAVLGIATQELTKNARKKLRQQGFLPP